MASAIPHPRRPSHSSAPAPAPATALAARAPSAVASSSRPSFPPANGVAGPSSSSGWMGGQTRAPAAGPPAGLPKGLGVGETPTLEERTVAESLRKQVALAIARDEKSTADPSLAPFASLEDAVARLLPYHVWQIPGEDLRVDAMLGLWGNRGAAGASSLSSGAKGKGKGRARDWETTEEQKERLELKQAISFAKRKRALEKQFKELRTSEGKHASPAAQAIVIDRLFIDSELAATVAARGRLESVRSQIATRQNHLAAGGAPVHPAHISPSNGFRPPLPHQPSSSSSSSSSSAAAYLAQPSSTSHIAPSVLSIAQPYQPYPSHAQRQSSSFPQSSSAPSTAAPSSSLQPSQPPPAQAQQPGGLDMKVPIPLLLPRTTLRPLMDLGIVQLPNLPQLLVRNLRADGPNIAFSVTLSHLNSAQLAGLAELLRKNPAVPTPRTGAGPGPVPGGAGAGTGPSALHTAGAGTQPGP